MSERAVSSDWSKRLSTFGKTFWYWLRFHAGIHGLQVKTCGDEQLLQVIMNHLGDAAPFLFLGLDQFSRQRLQLQGAELQGGGAILYADLQLLVGLAQIFRSDAAAKASLTSSFFLDHPSSDRCPD